MLPDPVALRTAAILPPSVKRMNRDTKHLRQIRHREEPLVGIAQHVISSPPKSAPVIVLIATPLTLDQNRVGLTCVT